MLSSCLTSSFLIGTSAMATESEAGVKLPRGVGIITENVVKSRPDLTNMVGFTVRIPRSFDIEANDGPQRVWVQGPNDHPSRGPEGSGRGPGVRGSGPDPFRTP